MATQAKTAKKNNMESGFKDGRATRSGHGAAEVAQPRAGQSEAKPLALSSVALVHGPLGLKSALMRGLAAPRKVQAT